VRTGEAVMKLVSMGYHFELVGEKVRYDWQGPGEPDPDTVRPLLDLVRQNKDAALYFLRSYCLMCGGVAFCQDYEGRLRCLSCEWEELVRLYPGMAGRKH
jgi:hypothetical protein